MDAAILLPSVRTEVRGESGRIFSIQESNVTERTTPALPPILCVCVCVHIYIYIYIYNRISDFEGISSRVPATANVSVVVLFRLSRPLINHLGDCFSWSHILQNSMCIFVVEYNELILFACKCREWVVTII